MSINDLQPGDKSQVLALDCVIMAMNVSAETHGDKLASALKDVTDALEEMFEDCDFTNDQFIQALDEIKFTL